MVTAADVDLRPGGRWRDVMTANGGFEVAFHGEYREIVPNERIDSMVRHWPGMVSRSGNALSRAKGRRCG